MELNGEKKRRENIIQMGIEEDNSWSLTIEVKLRIPRHLVAWRVTWYDIGYPSGQQRIDTLSTWPVLDYFHF